MTQRLRSILGFMRLYMGSVLVGMLRARMPVYACLSLFIRTAICPIFLSAARLADMSAEGASNANPDREDEVTTAQGQRRM